MFIIMEALKKMIGFHLNSFQFNSMRSHKHYMSFAAEETAWQELFPNSRAYTERKKNKKSLYRRRSSLVYKQKFTSIHELDGIPGTDWNMSH